MNEVRTFDCENFSSSDPSITNILDSRWQQHVVEAFENLLK